MKNNLKAKIDAVRSTAASRWKEQARFRRDNPWLAYSSKIARRILAVIRERSDLNQSRLAEMLEVSPQQITKIVKGKENLTLETIYKLSKALETELIAFPEYEYSKPLGGALFQLSEAKMEAKVIKMNSFIELPSTETPYSVNAK